MGRHEQLARDFKSFEQRVLVLLQTATEGAFSLELYKEVYDEAQSRLDMFQTVVNDVPGNARRGHIVANILRDLVTRFSRQADAADAARDLRSCIEAEVLPFIEELITARRKATAISAQLVEARGPHTDTKVGNWTLGACVGRGGQAHVYKVSNTVTGASLCMKTIPFARDMLERQEQKERFEREVRVPAEVNHPALVPIYDAGESAQDEIYWFLMPYISGYPINVWAAGEARANIVRKFISLLLPIGECHVKGLVHRDLKPSNILVESLSQQAWILDFGLSAMAGRKSATATGQFLGTVAYVSPEQAKDARNADSQSDIWSLGVILYEILSGSAVFAQTSDAEVLAAVLSGSFTDPEAYLGAAYARIIRRCLTVDPLRRFETVADLSGALTDALTDDQGVLSPKLISQFTHLKSAGGPNSCEFCFAPEQHGARCSNCGHRLGMG